MTRFKSFFDGYIAPNAHMFLIILLCSILLTLMLPHPAYADAIDDFVCGTFKDACNSLLQDCTKFMQETTAENLLTGSFGGFFLPSGSKDGTDSIYNLISDTHKKFVIPVGQSLLAAAILVQLIKISQKADSSATLPMVKEIGILIVFYVLFNYLINHGPELCSAIFDQINTISKHISGDKEIALSLTVGDTKDMAAGSMIVLFICCIFMWLGSLAAGVIAFAMAAARALQLYIMALLSPIPLALMSFEETRQMGISYLKNFAAVCLAGTILVFLLIAFPLIFKTILLAGATAGSGAVPIITDAALDVVIFVKMIGVLILMALAIIKSGSWARDVLGG